jgi:hypothetical protein
MNTSEKMEALRELDRKDKEKAKREREQAEAKKQAAAQAEERAKYKAFKKEMEEELAKVVVSVQGIEFKGEEILDAILRVPKGLDQYGSTGLFYQPDDGFRKYLVEHLNMPGAQSDLTEFIRTLEEVGFITFRNCGTVRRYGVGSDSYDWDETTYHYTLSDMGRKFLGQRRKA